MALQSEPADAAPPVPRELPRNNAPEVVAVPAGATGEPAPEPARPGTVPEIAAGGIPRWFLLVAGLAAATVAVAGLRAVAWLVGPVLLALVVVVAIAPVQSWLQRHGTPRWL